MIVAAVGMAVPTFSKLYIMGTVRLVLLVIVTFALSRWRIVRGRSGRWRRRGNNCCCDRCRTGLVHFSDPFNS